MKKLEKRLFYLNQLKHQELRHQNYGKDHFNPPTNYQVLAPLWNEDMVITTQAIVVGTK